MAQINANPITKAIFGTEDTNHFVSTTFPGMDVIDEARFKPGSPATKLQFRRVDDQNRRALKQVEINEAKSVFLDTIDYGLVLIADKLGYGNRAFTNLHKHITSRDEYTLYMGKAVYDNDASLDWATFIHEMTHAWQGQNHWISSGYMWNSVVSQAIDGNTAYDYKPGNCSSAVLSVGWRARIELLT